MEKKILRVSQFKDYIAVDIVNEEMFILATPFYLKAGHDCKNIFYKDAETGKWNKTEVHISEDFKKLICIDSEMEFDCDFSELTENHIRFIQQQDED